MKKIFAQLGEGILKYKKKLIYGALALFIGQICFLNIGGFGISNQVYAQNQDSPTQNSTFQQKASNWLQDLSFIQRAFYVLLYPILALAGLLVNNSFVYAEAFKFDAVLWQLWNVVRNLANYALGFIFIFKIFQFLTSGQKSSDMLKLLKSTLIAGIGIQASWFLLAVLIDISNIVAYGVGGLPIKTLGQQADSDNFGNPYVFRTVVYADTDTPNSVQFYLSTTGSGNRKFISECKTFSYSYDSGDNKIYQELILAPKMVYYYDGNMYMGTEQTSCHIGDDVYYFNGLYDGDPKINRRQCSGTGCKNEQNTYIESVDNTMKKLQSTSIDEIRGFINDKKILEIGDAHAGTTDLGIKYGENEPYGLDVDNNWKGEELGLSRLNNILSGNYVGVFTALYSSLLNAGTDLRVSEVTDPGIYTSLLNVILSLCHTIAIGIPLIAMLVVFLMRIGIIWMAIILSPAIVLMEAFGRGEKLKNLELLKYLTVGNLIGIIFSPAIVCFAVSISTVLVRVINAVNMQGIMTEDSYILGGLIKLNIAGLGLNIGKLVCSVIGVAISWFLIWTAVKASELGKSKVVTGLESLAKTAIGSVPIIPVPKKEGGVDFVGTSTVFGGNGQEGVFSKISNNLQHKYSEENNQALDDFFKSDAKKQEEAATRQLSAYREGIVKSNIDENWVTTQIMIGENKDTPKTFGDFYGSEQESIITAINNMGKDKLNGIPNGHEVTLDGNVKYKFVRTKPTTSGGVEDVYKYEKQ